MIPEEKSEETIKSAIENESREIEAKEKNKDEINAENIEDPSTVPIENKEGKKIIKYENKSYVVTCISKSCVVVEPSSLIENDNQAKENVKGDEVEKSGSAIYTSVKIENENEKFNNEEDSNRVNDHAEVPEEELISQDDLRVKEELIKNKSEHQERKEEKIGENNNSESVKVNDVEQNDEGEKEVENFEVEEVEKIGEEKKTEEVNHREKEEENVYEEIEEFHSLDIDQINKTLFGAVQKLIKRNEELETKVKNLYLSLGQNY